MLRVISARRLAELRGTESRARVLAADLVAAREARDRAALRASDLAVENARYRHQQHLEDARSRARAVIKHRESVGGLQFSELELRGLLARVELTDGHFDQVAYGAVVDAEIASLYERKGGGNVIGAAPRWDQQNKPASAGGQD